jgi:hypothetical protein
MDGSIPQIGLVAVVPISADANRCARGDQAVASMDIVTVVVVGGRDYSEDVIHVEGGVQPVSRRPTRSRIRPTHNRLR